MTGRYLLIPTGGIKAIPPPMKSANNGAPRARGMWMNRSAMNDGPSNEGKDAKRYQVRESLGIVEEYGLTLDD